MIRTQLPRKCALLSVVLAFVLLSGCGNGPSSTASTGILQVVPSPQVTTMPVALTIVSLDTSGNPMAGSGQAISGTGRYLAFFYYVPGAQPPRWALYERDTCLAATPDCVATTIAFPPQGRISVLGVSSDGRYIPFLISDAEAFVDYGLYYADSCNGGPSGCVPTAEQVVPKTLRPGSNHSTTSDGRYAAYAVGGGLTTAPFAINIYDSCANGPGGCATAAIPMTMGEDFLSISADGQYLALARSGATRQIAIRNTCLGAPSTCVSSEATVSSQSLDCFRPLITGDAQYVVYSCNVESVQRPFFSKTCVPSAGDCMQITTPLPGLDSSWQAVGDARMSNGGRFAFFTAMHSTVSNQAIPQASVFVYDTCQGGPAQCTQRIAPLCVNSAGTIANEDCFLDDISADGRYILFDSAATNLTALPSLGGLVYRATNPLQ